MRQSDYRTPIFLSTMEMIRRLKRQNLIDQDFPEDIPLQPDPEGKIVLVYVHPRFLQKEEVQVS